MMRVVSLAVAPLAVAAVAACSSAPTSLSPGVPATTAATSSSSSLPVASTTTIAIDPLAARPATKGPAERFTGNVTVQPYFAPHGERHSIGALVTFQPGARTAWHSHPHGQTLVVTEGVGAVQQRGGPRQTITAGDVVWTPPGVVHWHGATGDSAMRHIALVETDDDGKTADWFEHVSNTEAGNP